MELLEGLLHTCGTSGITRSAASGGMFKENSGRPSSGTSGETLSRTSGGTFEEICGETDKKTFGKTEASR